MTGTRLMRAHDTLENIRESDHRERTMVLINQIDALHLLGGKLLDNLSKLAVDLHVGDGIQSTRSLLVSILQELFNDKKEKERTKKGERTNEEEETARKRDQSKSETHEKQC